MHDTRLTDARQRRSRSLRAGAAALAAATLLGATPAAFAESPNKGRISFSAGSDFTTAYFFRGILQERDGLIWQPYGEVNVNLFSADESDTGPVRGLTLLVGMWNSIQSEKTLASGSGPGNWYESDFYAGGKMSLFGNTEAKVYYIAYTYPGGAFQTVQEIDAQFSLTDTEWLGKFALYPYVLFAGEFDNTALGTQPGVYTEVGVRPSFTIIDSETYPVSLAFPLKVGLSMGDYSEGPNGKDYTFGYFQGGPVFSIPLAFIPAEYGSWGFAMGASVYAFGVSTKAYNKDDSPWVVGTASLTFAY